MSAPATSSPSTAPASETAPAANPGRPAGLARHAIMAIEVDQPARRDNPVAAGLYRAFEFAASFAGLVLLLPLMLLQVIIIRIDSPGPALFFQTRCGRSKIVPGRELMGRTDIISATGRFEADKLYWVPTTFQFVKFRTMYVDARARAPDLYRYEFDSHEAFRSAFYKVDDDPRVTPVGRWLRRLSLDELPNLWSVVTGKVGLVGPRPEGPFYLPFYSALEMTKFTVRPGITGLAVVNGRGSLRIGEQLDWDLAYVRTRSVKLDLKILLATAKLVLTLRGAF